MLSLLCPLRPVGEAKDLGYFDPLGRAAIGLFILQVVFDVAPTLAVDGLGAGGALVPAAVVAVVDVVGRPVAAVVGVLSLIHI